MTRKLSGLIAMLWATAFSNSLSGQASPATVVEIDVVNAVNYENDTGDYSKLATDSAPTVGVASNNFFSFTGIGDIVAVNGKPAKGVFILRNTALNLRPTPAPGQAIADVARANISQVVLSWFSQKWREAVLGKVVFRPSGGDF